MVSYLGPRVRANPAPVVEAPILQPMTVKPHNKPHKRPANNLRMRMPTCMLYTYIYIHIHTHIDTV